MSEKKTTPVKPVTPKQVPRKAPVNVPKPKITPLRKDTPPPSRGIGRPPKN